MSSDTNDEFYGIGHVLQTRSQGGVLLTPRLAGHRLRAVCEKLGEYDATTESGRASDHPHVWAQLALLYDSQEAHEFAQAMGGLDWATACAQYPLFETMLCGGGGVQVARHSGGALSWVQFQGVRDVMYICQTQRRVGFLLAYTCYAYEIGALLDPECVARFEGEQGDTVWSEERIVSLVGRLVAQQNNPDREALFTFELLRTLPISSYLARSYARHLALINAY
jgi:hypothetical protein